MAPVMCLGEALVDLICERPVATMSEAGALVARFGGAVANAAIVAARCGAPVALAGGAGDDEWGAWLRRRLEREGVDVSRFTLIPGTRTPLALVSTDAAGEPGYAIYGNIEPTIVHALDGGAADAVDACSALFFSSNTLVDEEERTVTMAAREAALQRGCPIVFDPNVRLHRWGSPADAAAFANACVPGTLLVRANQQEAALMTGESDPERAALAIAAAGARTVVVTLGPRGAILRGELRADVGGMHAAVISTVGAGDVLTGVLLGRLALGAYDPSAILDALPEAVAAAARACERWGALD